MNPASQTIDSSSNSNDNNTKCDSLETTTFARLVPTTNSNGTRELAVPQPHSELVLGSDEGLPAECRFDDPGGISSIRCRFFIDSKNNRHESENDSLATKTRVSRKQKQQAVGCRVSSGEEVAIEAEQLAQSSPVDGPSAASTSSKNSSLEQQSEMDEMPSGSCTTNDHMYYYFHNNNNNNKTCTYMSQLQTKTCNLEEDPKRKYMFEIKHFRPIKSFDQPESPSRSAEMAKTKKRVSLSPDQRARLMEVYQVCKHPPRQVKVELARELGLEAQNIQVWFQNRRQRDKEEDRSGSFTPSGSSSSSSSSGSSRASTPVTASPKQSQAVVQRQEKPKKRRQHDDSKSSKSRKELKRPCKQDASTGPAGGPQSPVLSPGPANPIPAPIPSREAVQDLPRQASIKQEDDLAGPCQQQQQQQRQQQVQLLRLQPRKYFDIASMVSIGLSEALASSEEDSPPPTPEATSHDELFQQPQQYYQHVPAQLPYQHHHHHHQQYCYPYQAASSSSLFHSDYHRHHHQQQHILLQHPDRFDQLIRRPVYQQLYQPHQCPEWLPSQQQLMFTSAQTYHDATPGTSQQQYHHHHHHHHHAYPEPNQQQQQQKEQDKEQVKQHQQQQQQEEKDMMKSQE